MPGNLISATCDCGFSGDGSPGDAMDGHVLVMAFDPGREANSTDEVLMTVPEDEALEHGLTIIKDPVMEYALGRIDSPGPWNGVRCPVCLKNTMTLAHSGYWD